MYIYDEKGSTFDEAITTVDIINIAIAESLDTKGANFQEVMSSGTIYLVTDIQRTVTIQGLPISKPIRTLYVSSLSFISSLPDVPLTVKCTGDSYGLAM